MGRITFTVKNSKGKTLKVSRRKPSKSPHSGKSWFKKMNRR